MRGIKNLCEVKIVHAANKKIIGKKVFSLLFPAVLLRDE